MADKKKKNRKVTIFELVMYPLCGAMALWGLTYITLGVICGFISSKTGLAEANAKLENTTNGMGFLEQGLLVLTIALVVAVIILLIFAKNSDREYEKDQRRAAARANRHFGKVEEDAPVVDADKAE